MKGLKLREIVVMAAISVVFGVIYLLLLLFGGIVKSAFGPIVWGLLTGVWVMAPIVCAYIIRKPGVALVAELIAAGAEIMFGSVNASIVMILGLTQGLGAELAFALFRYRVYKLPVLMLAGLLGTAANFFTIFVLYGYDQYSTLIVIWMLVSMLISGALLAGCGSKLIADALARTGVLNNFALGNRQQRQQRTRL